MLMTVRCMIALLSYRSPFALGGALEPGHLTASTVAASIAFEPSEQP